MNGGREGVREWTGGGGRRSVMTAEKREKGTKPGIWERTCLASTFSCKTLYDP